MSRPRFTNRVRITGTLTLTTDLYLSDGGVEERDQNRGEGKTDVATVTRDASGLPTIPGSALRGVIRSYLESMGGAQILIDGVFGKGAKANTVNRPDLTDDEMGFGGKVEFSYARFAEASTLPDNAPVSGYSVARRTGSSTFVGLERQSRTASDRTAAGRRAAAGAPGPARRRRRLPAADHHAPAD